MRADWITTTPVPLDASGTLTVVSVLDDYGVLEIAGPDSSKFLQGQLTCNLQDITLSQSRPGAHCTHQGRMVASFRLLQADTSRHFFVLPTDTLPLLQAALAKYIVFSKAKLRNVSDDYLTLGISGPQAATLVSQLFGSVPAGTHAQVLHDNGIAICVDAHTPRYLCLLPAAQAESLWPAIDKAGTVTDHHVWHWLDIRAGLGEVRRQTSGEFIPQMLNLQVLDGISFTKGCYTGQEIVARMQYRGTLKKSMQGISGTGPAPSPNAPLRHPGSEQAAGHVVQALAVDEQRWEGLAVLPHDDDASLVTEDGHAVQRVALPYTVLPPENRK